MEATGQQASSTHTLRLHHLHGPDVNFGSVLPVSEQLGGSVGRTSTLGVEELQGQRFSLQSVAQAKVCVKHHRFNSGAHAQMDLMAKTGSATLICPTFFFFFTAVQMSNRVRCHWRKRERQHTHNLYVVVLVQKEVFDL